MAEPEDREPHDLTDEEHRLRARAAVALYSVTIGVVAAALAIDSCV
jgi:hypothetical protein